MHSPLSLSFKVKYMPDDKKSYNLDLTAKESVYKKHSTQFKMMVLLHISRKLIN